MFHTVLYIGLPHAVAVPYYRSAAARQWVPRVKSIRDSRAVKNRPCSAYTKNYIFPKTDKSNVQVRALVSACHGVPTVVGIRSTRRCSSNSSTSIGSIILIVPYTSNTTVHTIPPWGRLPSSIARQPRGYQYRNDTSLESSPRYFSNADISAPALFQLWRCRPCKIGPGGVIHTVVTGIRLLAEVAAACSSSSSSPFTNERAHKNRERQNDQAYRVQNTDRLIQAYLCRVQNTCRLVQAYRPKFVQHPMFTPFFGHKTPEIWHACSMSPYPAVDDFSFIFSSQIYTFLVFFKYIFGS